MKTSVAACAVAMLVLVSPTVLTRLESSGGQGSQAISSADEIRIGFLRNGSYEVSTLQMEPYVARVLAGEAARDSPSGALEALAIAIRTYAVANRGRHRADGFDLCDQTHCQVVRTATPVTQQAVQATASQVLMFNGAPASIFYSASCGGRSERPSSVWPGAVDPPYLPVHADDACDGQPVWSAELRLPDAQRALQAAGYRGTLRSIRIGSRNESGRVSTLVLDGLDPREISGQDLRMAMARTAGAPQILSATFEMSRTREGSYRFEGRGYGHGVGMCVIGSVNLAARGVGAREILQRYFPGTTLSASRLTVAPPPGEEGARPALLNLAGRMRDDLAKTLGVAPSRGIALRMQPSSTEYERVSGRPWFTFGSVVNGELQLLPASVLEERGMLEVTLRRLLTRMLTEQELASRPLWVREGIALHFGDLPAASSRPSASNAGGPCPSDDELRRPISPGALADAYARARGCVERQLRGGRSWREVR